MRASLLALVLAGCSFQAKQAGGAAGDDAPVDAAIISPDSAPLDGKLPAVCLGSLVNVCVDPPTDAAIVPTSLNTDSSPACARFTSSPDVDACVIAGTSITMNDKIVVTGHKKLILLSTSAITLNNVLDVASHVGGTTGPGADADPCNADGNPVLLAGGAGGSFVMEGADGGDSPAGGAGRAAKPLTAPATLRGGCQGATGGASNTNRGHGGGSVLLVAMNTITIDSNGSINASGASGTRSGGGGGGGGSGGMIVLDAPNAVTLNGKCFANGGAGAGAGTFGSKNNGTDGTDSDAPDHRATGGNGNDLGGSGGDGSLGTDSPSNGNSGKHTGPPIGGPNGSGGGGGGAAGVIDIITKTPPTNTSDPAKLSPPPTISAPRS